MGQKETTAEVAEDRKSSRKQAGVKAGREERTGWVEMEEMLSSIRRVKSLWTRRGAEPRSLCIHVAHQAKKFKNLLTITSSRQGWKARPARSLLQAGLLPKAVGFFFDLVPAKIHLQRGLGPGSTAWSPGGYTRRSCTILRGFNLGRNRTALHPEITACCFGNLPGDTHPALY